MVGDVLGVLTAVGCPGYYVGGLRAIDLAVDTLDRAIANYRG